MVTISIQRYILKFEAHLLHVRFKHYTLYYLPLPFCLIYPIVFYPCDGTQWDSTSNLCGYANCYLLYNKVLSTFDCGQ
jgi:hypothetical protein